jgi:hypothetical protein
VLNKNGAPLHTGREAQQQEREPAMTNRHPDPLKSGRLQLNRAAVLAARFEASGDRADAIEALSSFLAGICNLSITNNVNFCPDSLFGAYIDARRDAYTAHHGHPPQEA